MSLTYLGWVEVRKGDTWVTCSLDGSLCHEWDPESDEQQLMMFPFYGPSPLIDMLSHSIESTWGRAVEPELPFVGHPNAPPPDPSPPLTRFMSEFAVIVKGWVLSDELEAVAWDREVVVSGLTNPDDAHLFSDPPVRIPNTDRLGGGVASPGRQSGVPVRWIESLGSVAFGQHTELLGHLKACGGLGRLTWFYPAG